jgi:hypothetical protein
MVETVGEATVVVPLFEAEAPGASRVVECRTFHRVTKPCE